MFIKQSHLIGFGIGIGVSAIGFYMFEKNRPKIEKFLRSNGINIPDRATLDRTHMSIEELMAEKEKIEDMIAEKELKNKSVKAKA